MMLMGRGLQGGWWNAACFELNKRVLTLWPRLTGVYIALKSWQVGNKFRLFYSCANLASIWSEVWIALEFIS